MTDPLTDPATDPAADRAADELADRLTLADWRRRVAALYVEVRAMAASDPAIALSHWRAVRERLYREHPQSPVPVDQRSTFRALHFDHYPRLRFQAIVVPAAPPTPGSLALALPNSGTETLAFRRVGTVHVPFPDGERALSVFWMAGYAGGMFIPFRDETNGTSTYGAGRYLVDAAKSADLGTDATTTTLTLDFNFAYQPSCAFDARWACPLAPPENRLDIEVRAGERLA
ncbi:MAG: DUF1684 domain-containing protein [Candidatus Limnocylindrales bacterium]